MIYTIWIKFEKDRITFEDIIKLVESLKELLKDAGILEFEVDAKEDY